MFSEGLLPLQAEGEVAVSRSSRVRDVSIRSVRGELERGGSAFELALDHAVAPGMASKGNHAAGAHRARGPVGVHLLDDLHVAHMGGDPLQGVPGPVVCALPAQRGLHSSERDHLCALAL